VNYAFYFVCGYIFSNYQNGRSSLVFPRLTFLKSFNKYRPGIDHHISYSRMLEDVKGACSVVGLPPERIGLHSGEVAQPQQQTLVSMIVFYKNTAYGRRLA
jgi:hypothetical protein